VVKGLVGQVFSFVKSKLNGEPVLLFLVDVWKAVHEVKPALKSELCNHSQRLVTSAHIELVKPKAIVYALEVMVVVLPPLIEVTVGQFEDR
jgi:hypothetical protein